MNCRMLELLVEKSDLGDNGNAALKEFVELYSVLCPYQLVGKVDLDTTRGFLVITLESKTTEEFDNTIVESFQYVPQGKTRFYAFKVYKTLLEFKNLNELNDYLEAEC